MDRCKTNNHNMVVISMKKTKWILKAYIYILINKNENKYEKIKEHSIWDHVNALLKIISVL